MIEGNQREPDFPGLPLVGRGSFAMQTSIRPWLPLARAMPVLRTILCITLLSVSGSCRRLDDSAPIQSGGAKAAAKPRDVDLSVLRYDTGDRTEWPDDDLPLEHHFEVPEVPESILGPFPLDTIPKDD